MRRLAMAVGVAAAAVLTGCAAGAGPDGQTDRACKEIKAAQAGQAGAFDILRTAGADRLTTDQLAGLSGFAAQLRVIASDARGGALADQFGALRPAADAWERAVAGRDTGSLLDIGDEVERVVEACRKSGVVL